MTFQTSPQLLGGLSGLRGAYPGLVGNTEDWTIAQSTLSKLLTRLAAGRALCNWLRLKQMSFLGCVTH